MQIATLFATVGADVKDAQRGLQAVDTQLQKTAKGFKGVEKNRIGVDSASALSGIKAVQAQLGDLKKSFSGNLLGSASLGSFLGNLGATAVVGGLNAIKGGLGDMVQTGLDFNDLLERSNIAFTTMLGSQAKATAFLSQLQRFAVDTNYEFADLIPNTQKLLAYGFKSEQVIPMLTAIGDKVAALGGGAVEIDRVTRALGQMQAKGKVSAEEMQQLAEIGINGWKLLADATGKTQAQIMKMGEQGRLNSSAAIRLMLEGFEREAAGMMAKMAQTRSGMMSNLQDAFVMRAAEGTKPLFEETKVTIANLRSFLDGEGGKSLAQAMGSAGAVGGIAFNEMLTRTLKVGQYLPAWMKAGGDIANGLSDGVVQGTETVTKGFQSVSESALKFFRSFWGIESPSKVMIVQGQNIAQGFIDGLESKRDEIIAAMARVFGRKGAESLFNRGVMFGPGFFTSGHEDWDKAIADFSKQRGLDPRKVYAQLLQESGLNPNAVSSAGARGLAQFMPGTARQYNLNPSDPVDSIRAQTEFMGQLLRRFGNYDWALTAYNAGPKRVQDSGFDLSKLARESQEYAPRINRIADLISSGSPLVAGIVSTEKILQDLRRVIAENAVREFEKNLPAARFNYSGRDPFAVGGTALPIFDNVSKLGDLVELKQPIIELKQPVFDLNTALEAVPPNLTLASEALKTAADQTKAAVEVTKKEQAENLKTLIGGQNSIFEGAAKGIETVFNDAFNSIFEEGFGGFSRKLLQGFTELVFQLVAKALTAKLVEKLFGGAGGAGGAGSGGFDFGGLFGGLFKSLSGVFKGVFSFFGALFGGASFGGLFADGGPVSSNKSYIVGERGPEIFVPNTSGMIVPNHVAFGSGQGERGQAPVIINYHITTPTGNIPRETQSQMADRTLQTLRRQQARSE